MQNASQILDVLDACCDAYAFPMLDNGYVYLAATRMSLFRSMKDWAMVIEVFGHSPRSGVPDLHLYTFGSRLADRAAADAYATEQAYNDHLAKNPHNESRFLHPLAEGEWLEEGDSLFVSEKATTIFLRGRPIALPPRDDYARVGIHLEDPRRVTVPELCRFLAATRRDEVLATDDERRISIPAEMAPILQLDEWNHPDVSDDTARPSRSSTFRQLAHVLQTGDVGSYCPMLPANTHWSHWPEAGSL